MPSTGDVPEKSTPLLQTLSLSRLIGNTGWLLADQVLRMGLGVLFGVWLARYLGPTDFGTYTYVFAFAGLFGIVCSLGMDRIVVRDLVRYSAQRDSILGTAFAIRLVSGTTAALMSIVVFVLLRPEDLLMRGMLAVAVAALVVRAFDVIDLWFQAQIVGKYPAAARSVSSLLIFGVKVALIYYQAPLIAFVWAGLIEVVVLALSLLLCYRAQGLRLRAWQIDLSRTRLLLREGWPMVVSGVAIAIYMKIDLIMLGEMVGEHAVGVYGAATRISEIWYFVPMAIMSTLAPVLVTAREKGAAVYDEYMRRIFHLMSCLALAVAVPTTFLASPLVNLLFGPEYAEAGPVLAIHIWAALFVFLGVAQGPWSINEGLTKLYMQRTALGAIVNVLLNLVLIPSYGAIGAAVATVVSYALSAVVANVFDVRTRHIFMLQVESIALGRFFLRRK